MGFGGFGGVGVGGVGGVGGVAGKVEVSRSLEIAWVMAGNCTHSHPPRSDVRTFFNPIDDRLDLADLQEMLNLNGKPHV